VPLTRTTSRGGGRPWYGCRAMLKSSLFTAEGYGAAEIMRRAGVSKPCVWRWQERFVREGMAGLVRDKTRKPGLPTLPVALVDRVVTLTLTTPPAGSIQ